jgi:hypothetical protein
MSISETEAKRAEARMQARMKSGAGAVAARYDQGVSRVVVELDSGLELAFSPDLAEGLAHAKAEDLSEIEITPSGLGLHFPRLDADLYLPALLEGVMGSRRWMAAQIGRAGGGVSSPAKARAARENGKIGGRPRKAAA